MATVVSSTGIGAVLEQGAVGIGREWSGNGSGLIGAHGPLGKAILLCSGTLRKLMGKGLRRRATQLRTLFRPSRQSRSPEGMENPFDGTVYVALASGSPKVVELCICADRVQSRGARRDLLCPFSGIGSLMTRKR